MFWLPNYEILDTRDGFGLTLRINFESDVNLIFNYYFFMDLDLYT